MTTQTCIGEMLQDMQACLKPLCGSSATQDPRAVAKLIAEKVTAMNKSSDSVPKAKRPDLCVLVRNALLFKGEDKYESKLDQAGAELKHKIHRWSRSYHERVNLLLCIHYCIQVTCNIVPCKIVLLVQTVQDPCLVEYAMRLVLHHKWSFCYIMRLQVATSGFACCAVMTQTAVLFSVVITTSVS